MHIFFSLIVLGLVAAMSPTSGLAADTAASGTLKIPVVKNDAAASHLTLRFPLPVGDRDVTVDSAVAKARLGDVQVGDIVEVEVDQIDNPQHIKRLVSVARAVSGWCRVLVLAVALAIILAAALIVTCAIKKPLRAFLVGVDGRYSNSKCQLALWFGVVMMVYLAALILRVEVWGLDFLYGVDIPANLLALTGLSALTFGGAKAITTTKVDNAAKDAVNKSADAATAGAQADAAAARATQAQTAGAPPEVIEAHKRLATIAADMVKKLADEAAAAKTPKPKGTPNILADLIQNDQGDPDIGDFQMIFITLIAAITFAIAGYNFLGAIAQSAHVTLPDVDTTLLSGFGLGQGAYLIKKMASKPGEG
jgi:hypothetical protein